MYFSQTEYITFVLDIFACSGNYLSYLRVQYIIFCENYDALQLCDLTVYSISCSFQDER